MKVFCIESKSIVKGLVSVEKGVWYDNDTHVNIPISKVYSIDNWWYSCDLFITEQEFRDRKLTELGIW